MEYLVTESQRKASRSTCYIEFQKGQYHGCWQEDSVSLHDDLWTQNHLSVLFGRVLPDFDFYGITTVNAAQWEGWSGSVSRGRGPSWQSWPPGWRTASGSTRSLPSLGCKGWLHPQFVIS